MKHHVNPIPKCSMYGTVYLPTFGLNLATEITFGFEVAGFMVKQHVVFFLGPQPER